MKITIEEPRDPKNYPYTNVYHTVYGVMDCWAWYAPEVNEIRIVNQGNFFRTWSLIFHELCHWAIHKIFTMPTERKIHLILDIIDSKLTKYKKI